MRLYRDEKLSYRQIRAMLRISMYRIMQSLAEAQEPPRAWKRRPKNGDDVPPPEEVARLKRRYLVELVPLVRLAREEGWDWRRLRDLFLAEGVRIRGPGPVPKAER